MPNRKEKLKRLFRNTELKQTKRYSKKTSVIVLVSALILSLILTALGLLFINYEFTATNSFSKLVEENYILSVFLIILICALQVVVALIPSEAVEIAAGYAFGALPGAIYCTIGIVIGSVCVILLTRKLGRAFVESIYSREKIDSISWINTPQKLNSLIALIFFIPGTPKDLITYAVGLTRMSIPTYIALTTFARFPSIIISTLSGGALGESNIKSAVIFFAISAITGIIGYVAYTLKTKHRPTNSRLHKTNSNEYK